MTTALPPDTPELQARASALRDADPDFARWAAGRGVIRHRASTQLQVHETLNRLVAAGRLDSQATGLARLAAADVLANAGLWLTAQMTYVREIRLDGRPITADACKPDPQGHTGGALNMVIGYLGYLLANTLSGHTRAWVMGQGHCVAAIDAINLLTGNTSPAHAARYAVSDAGLSRFSQDFYRYAVDADGLPASPLGSHVNVHTAGGISEGGYLGFTELQYVHMPLPGERLVAFLSDGAWEEQRGSDWAARWWRAEDCGLVVPVMMANGRRIEQRTSVAQQGGAAWLAHHLRLNGFDPVAADGHDPAALACALLDAEARQQDCVARRQRGEAVYPFRLPYVIAECSKGFGFPGAGLNRAHNLPLSGNPSRDADALLELNDGLARLWQSPEALHEAATCFGDHEARQRPRERDHALTRRQVPALAPVTPDWLIPGDTLAPMAALDQLFCRLSAANPGHRVRIGNPDELASNRMTETLARFRHRVLAPEPGVAEAIDGAIITALNEEAVVSAALANKGGLNLVVSYEAFAPKMLGALRQEILFARHQKVAGQPPQWLSVPVLLTSHTWENGKNEQSHQDTTLCEALLGEMADTAVVRFPVDANSASACLADTYARRGEIHALVVAKSPHRVQLDGPQAEALVRDGLMRLRGQPGDRVQLVAVGALQLGECLKARERLLARGITCSVVVLLEPARFRTPRDRQEADVMAPVPHFLDSPSLTVLVSHTRPEPLLGLLPRLPAPAGAVIGLGYLNRGGTLDAAGMLFANRCSWLHILDRIAANLGDTGPLLDARETQALHGEIDPLPLIRQEIPT